MTRTTMGVDGDLVVSGEHARRLEAALRGARESVKVVSPWITAKGLNWLKDAVPPSVRLEIVFRWPERIGDLGATDIEALDESRRWDRAGGTEITCVRHLHAKAYIVDDSFALVTSGNLTARGLGLGGESKSSAVNEELGVVLRGKKAVSAVHEWFGDLPRRLVSEEKYDQLKKRKNENAELFEQIKKSLDVDPPDFDDDERPVELALARLKEQGRITKYEAVRRLAGRGFFRIWLPGRKTATCVRARTSQSGNVEARNYHFEITRADVKDWETKKKTSPAHRIEGNLFVPVKPGGKDLADDGAPVVLALFDKLFRRDRLRKTVDFPAGQANRRVYLEPSERGAWTLRLTPGPTRLRAKPIVLKGRGTSLQRVP